jgi:hypothetical protein
MNKYILVATLFTCCLTVKAQKEFDNVITVTIDRNVYETIRIAFVNADFIVKDNGNKDTLTTYPREMHSIPGFMVARAIINGNTVKIFGTYGLMRINDWGYTITPKKYQPVAYYKGSKTWRLLYEIGKRTGAQMVFSKE